MQGDPIVSYCRQQSLESEPYKEAGRGQLVHICAVPFGQQKVFWYHMRVILDRAARYTLMTGGWQQNLLTRY